jgi:hypothetical protein
MGKMNSAERAEMFAIIRDYVKQGKCIKVQAHSIERVQQLAQIASRLECDIKFETRRSYGFDSGQGDCIRAQRYDSAPFAYVGPSRSWNHRRWRAPAMIEDISSF